MSPANWTIDDLKIHVEKELSRLLCKPWSPYCSIELLIGELETRLAATPVPPAGKEAKEKDLRRALFAAFGIAYCGEDSGEMADIAMQVFQDHVARVTAEGDRLKADMNVMTAARNALRSRVNELEFSERSLNREANDLQSELTKALELQGTTQGINQL